MMQPTVAAGGKMPNATDNQLAATERRQREDQPVASDGPGNDMHDDHDIEPELPVATLSPEVAANVVVELGARGDRVVAYVRTAATLIEQIAGSNPELRLAETVAYNLREALDSIVAGRDAAVGGLAAIEAAWNEFNNAQQLAQEAQDAAAAALHEIVARAVQDSDRNSYRARQLVDYLRTKTGVEPLRGEASSLARYTKLRERANSALHSDTTADDVVALYADCLDWLTFMFTRPEKRAAEIVHLAQQTYTDPEQLDRVRELCSNPHQLRLFLSGLTDPGWLDALHDADIVQLPGPGAHWPFDGVVDGLGATAPQPVAELLLRFVEDIKKLDEPTRPLVAFEIIRAAVRLGEAGHRPAWKVIDAYGASNHIQVLAVEIAKQADPAAPIVRRVADAVLTADAKRDDSYLARTTLALLTAGLDAENAEHRIRLVAVKLQNMANSESMRYQFLDTVSLTAELDNLDDVRRVTAHYLVRLARRARELGVDTLALLDWTRTVPSELGARFTCQLLAGANDVPASDKINHIASRVASATVTGDDRDLVIDILSDETVFPDAVAIWSAALGTPSPTPEHSDTDDPPLPGDWVRVWQWSVILPAECVTDWRPAIAAVTERHGEPDASALDTPLPRGGWRMEDSSPIPAQDLAEMGPAAAAATLAAWRPDMNDAYPDGSKYDLARAFERAAEQHLDEWAAQADQIVATLNDPVYVAHFLRALTDSKLDVTPHAASVLAAIKLTSAAWASTTPTGEPATDRTRTDLATFTADLIVRLAEKGAALSADFADLWAFAAALTLAHPEEHSFSDPLGEDDALNSAIGQPWGKGLYALLALAAWQYRTDKQIPPGLPDLLDAVVAIPDAVGLELRAIIAERRPLLETYVHEWLEQHATTLFGDDTSGQATFDITVKWARPTSWFLNRYRDRLAKAARRGSDRAVHYLLIGAFWQKNGYAIDEILTALRSAEDALGELCEQMAGLMQDAEPDSTAVQQATGFWRAVLDADRTLVPARPLVKLGRWAFVTNVDSDAYTVLMTRTLQTTDGAIDYPIEVADRWRTLGKPTQSLGILLALLGHGAPWERDYVERSAVDCLRAAAATAAVDAVVESFNLLRSRLINRGRYEARNITLA